MSSLSLETIPTRNDKNSKKYRIGCSSYLVQKVGECDIQSWKLAQGPRRFEIQVTH